MARELTFHDPERPNKLRLVEHGGNIYVEVSARHDDGRYHVSSVVRVDRLRFVSELIGWLA